MPGNKGKYFANTKEFVPNEGEEIDEDYEVGEEVTEEVSFISFGRRAILTLRQTLASKILELEKDSLFHKYKDIVDYNQQIFKKLSVLMLK